MARKVLKKGMAIALTLLLLMAFAMPAMAASEQVYATTPLNVRSGPGTNYPIVGDLKKGEVATRIGTSGNWSILQMGNAKVYAHSAYLSPHGATGTGESTRYTTGNVNVRTGPGTGYKVISTLKKGDMVSVVGSVGNWSIIKWNAGTAYLFTSYLTTSSSGGGSSSTATGLMEATSGVNVRSGPGTKYSIVGVLKKGEQVTRTGVSGNWTQVIYKNKTAYVSTGYLRLVTSTQEVKPASGTMKATSPVNVRSGPGTSYSIVGELMRNETVTRTGVIGNWTQVLYRNKTAYVSSAYLTLVTNEPDVKPASGTFTVGASVNAHTGPGTEYNVAYLLKKGETVTRTGIVGGWTELSYKGQRIYVPSNYLVPIDASVKPTDGFMEARSDTKVYTGPGTDYSVLGTLYRYEVVERTGEVGNWTQITFNNKTGYVLTANLRLLDSFTKTDKSMFTTENNAPVYEQPSTLRQYLYDLLKKNTEVRVTGLSYEFARVQIQGRTRYIPLTYLSDYYDAGLVSGDALKLNVAGPINAYTDVNLKNAYTDTIDDTQGLTFKHAVNKDVYLIHWAEKNMDLYVRAADVVKK